MTDKPFDLNMHTARLLMREPFFAALSRRIDKIRTDSVPTAGVRVNPDSAQFELEGTGFEKKIEDSIHRGKRDGQRSTGKGRSRDQLRRRRRFFILRSKISKFHSARHELRL